MEASEAIVEGLEEILMLPVRLCPQGELLHQRRSAEVSPDKLMGRYVDAVTAGGKWAVQDGYFDVKAPFRKAMTPARNRSYAEFVYFHRFIQKMLFERKTPVRVLARTDIGAARIGLEDGEILQLDVRRVQMFLFPTDIAVLVVQLSGRGKEIAFRHALEILNRARRMFPPFFEDSNQAGLCPRRVEWIPADGSAAPDEWKSDYHAPNHFLDHVIEERKQPLAGHWRALLEPLRAEGDPRAGPLTFEQFEDDRVPILAYVPVKGTGELRRQDQIRLGLLEEASAGPVYPYAQSFLGDFEAKHCYDRYYEPPRLTTRYFLTSYSFTAMGRQSDWFFRELLRRHFEQHYFVMVLIAQAQRVSLLVFWDRLAEISSKYAEAGPTQESRNRLRTDLKGLIEDFADFSARFWFSEVSNQIQPTELFDRYSEHLGTRRLFGEVKEQIELMREVQMAADAEDHAVFEKASTRLQNGFTRLQELWFPLLLATGVLGMDGAFAETTQWFEKALRGSWFFLEWRYGLPFEFWARVILLLAMWAIFAALVQRTGRAASGEKNLTARETENAMKIIKD